MLRTRKLGWELHWPGIKQLKIGWLALAALFAVYLAAARPYNYSRGIARERGIGVAAQQGTEPLAPWHQLGTLPRLRVARVLEVGGVVGGVPGGLNEDKNTALASMAMLSPSSGVVPPQDATADRKIIRTSSMEIVVQRPADAAEKIRSLAEHVGGFLVSSEVRGGQDATGGSLTIRVPVGRFEEVRTEIRKLGLRVESERIEAQDVTRQYVDQEAILRNLRAEESQYLGILKQARTVKDTLEVSEKLSEVRGEVERQQAEFDALTKQVETVAITVSLRAEAEAQVFGLHWRPLYQVKLAFREGLDGLADYCATMTSVVFYMPAVVLWLGTILIGAAVGWKVARWAWRRLFGWGAVRTPASVQTP
jgi:hypothetical protein